MRYHNITHADMLNGEGLRVVLWVSGCHHHCPGCHNVVTWNCKDGLEFDDKAREEIFKDLEEDWCSGITLSGGDPLFKGNRSDIVSLVCEIKEKYPDKSIWLYTGYTWEELIDEDDDVIRVILNNIDVLLDGKFMLKFADERLHYVGSSNQRIIDVKKSLKKQKIILYIDNSNLEDSL